MADLVVLFSVLGGVAAVTIGLPVQLETRAAVTSRLANVHLSAARSVDYPITVTYGPCTSPSIQDAHHVLGNIHGSISDPTRLVWILPEDTESGGCLSAWTTPGTLVGRSAPQMVQNLQTRRAERRAGICLQSFVAWGMGRL
jgi:hypothetical protein